MNSDDACRIIDALGGNAEVAKLTKAPATTVHGWRRVGLSASRLDHIWLAAMARRPDIDLESIFGTDHSGIDTAEQQPLETGNGNEVSGQQVAA